MMSQGETRPARFWRRRVELFTGIVAACSILTLSARDWWVADLIANLRVQLVIGMLVAILVLLSTRRWKLLAVMLLLTCWQAAKLHSAVQSGDRISEVSSSEPETNVYDKGSLRVFLANVLTRNLHHDQIIAQIQASDPDMIVILELSSALEGELNRKFGATHEYSVSESQDDGNFGIGLWSRYPLSNARVFHLNTPILPSIEADVLLPLRTTHVVATHTLPPVGARNFDHRNRHLALLARRIEKRRRAEPLQPVILLGDLNLTPWSPFFDDFLALSGLSNSAKGRGLQPTWYRWPAFPFGLILDHGLLSDELKCDRRTIQPDNGSDHRALVFDFSPNATR